MEWSDILIDSYNRVPEYLGSILEDLTPDDLKWQPDRNANSIGWLTWHLTRQHDAQLADLMGDEQLWVRDGWAKRFKRPADGSDTGFGDTPEQVAAFDPPDNATILAYQKAVSLAVVDRSGQGTWRTVDADSHRRGAAGQHSARCRYPCRAGCLRPRAAAGSRLASLLAVSSNWFYFCFINL